MKLDTKYIFWLFAGLVLLMSGLSSHAEIVKILIGKSESYNNGKIYGAAGEYERVSGKAYGEIDPTMSLNTIIQDITLAPRNAKGRVEYVSEFILLRPKNRDRSNRILFLSLPNRGNAFTVDTALINRGYTILWAAWQGDVLPGNGRLVMNVPVATNSGKTITGKLRTEYQVTSPVNTLNLSSGYYSGTTHHSYETVTLNNAGLVLTRRIHEADPKDKIPNTEWAFSDCRSEVFPGKPDATKISLKNGFDPNYIYELVYNAKDPLVLGLGFAAVRDIASFLRHEVKDKEGNLSPALTSLTIESPIHAAILQGVSQCGNFTRSFLHLGFNQDEKGRIVFDGVNTHVATRRISLNVRFGRPGGGGIQREDHLFPSNEPPFTWDTTFEPLSGITGGILENCIRTNTCPKIIQTLSSSEYWQLRASQRTADAYGNKDLPIPDNVRIYLFAGTQHGPSSSIDKTSGFAGNSNSYSPGHRALLIALEQWVLNGTLPPSSSYPTLAKKTLVRSDKTSIGWPDIPGVPYNGRVNDGSLIDFGHDYNIENASGILREPPLEFAGKKYTILVPKVDSDGNEIAGIRNVSMRVPLGTYTGWSLRVKGYGEGDLAALSGMFIPFKKTRVERIAAGDSRLSLEERYTSHALYVSAVKKAADELVKEGFLLPSDALNEIANAQSWNVLD